MIPSSGVPQRRVQWDREGTLEMSVSAQRDTCLSSSEIGKAEQHRGSGGVGSGMWKRLQIDLSPFFFHTEKKRGTISEGDLSICIQDRLEIFFLKWILFF